jgi:hypothetical protein
MKSNKGLFEKKIDLKNCQINGGRLAATFTSCSVYTGTQGCRDSVTTMTDDKGVIKSETLTTW